MMAESGGFSVSFLDFCVLNFMKMNLLLNVIRDYKKKCNIFQRSNQCSLQSCSYPHTPACPLVELVGDAWGGSCAIGRVVCLRIPQIS